MNKKCINCKFSGSNVKNFYGQSACLYPKATERTYKVTTNSKDFTHCDKWELFNINKPKN